ncbi:MAG: nucleoside recognition protein [Rikenellaceae bacterium]|jgi:spore maturation protein SpmB|nr:nucleoside recognition protein [Rikenellaceae bacterium]
MESTHKPAGNFFLRLWGAVRAAFMPALRTSWWLIRITVPISLGMAVLSHVGVVQWISEILTPAFSLIGLDGRGALVFISAVLGHLYTGVAVMFTVGVGLREAILLAVMCLICHNIIIETAIQKRSGASALGMPLLRVGMAIVAAALLNLIIPTDIAGQLHGAGKGMQQADTWGGMLGGWAMTLWPLLLRMVVLITSLNILQSILREFGILDIIAWPLRPLMRLFGLPLSTSFLWIICNVIGLTYGGAALIDELQRGEATPDDARLLNTHVAISHSLLEDTVIFWSVGVPLIWLFVPRLVLAICAVWVQRLARRLSRNRKRDTEIITVA